MGRTKLKLYFLMLTRLMALNPDRGQLEPVQGKDGKARLQQKFRCWSCGLYQTEIEICKDCHRCNPWTLVQMCQETEAETKDRSRIRLKPEYEET